MKLYLSEYARFKPRDGKGKEGVVCTFSPFEVFDAEGKQMVTKGYFLTEVEKTIERLDKHPDKGVGFIEWKLSDHLPQIIHGRLIAANHNILKMSDERLKRIGEVHGPVQVRSGVVSPNEPEEIRVEKAEASVNPEDYIRLGELKAQVFKKDGEKKLNAPKELVDEFNKLSEKIGA
jgi:hypothetical protein